MQLWLVVACGAGVAAGLISVAVVVFVVCRRKRRGKIIGPRCAPPKQQQPKASIVVLPSIRKLSEHASKRFPFESQAGSASEDHPAAGKEALARVANGRTKSMPPDASDRMLTAVANDVVDVPIVTRGRKVSHQQDVYNETTPEMHGAMVKRIYAASPELVEETTGPDDRLPAPPMSPIGRTSDHQQSAAQGPKDEYTDVDLVTDDGGLDGSDGTAGPMSTRTDAMSACHQCPGFLCYSVRLAKGTLTGKRSQFARKGASCSELQVAVVSAFALTEVSKANHVLVQVELVSPDVRLRTPAMFVEKKSAIRHTKAVMRGGKVASAGSSEHEVAVSNLILEQWKQDVEANALDSDHRTDDEDLCDPLPPQQQWPFHEDLVPFTPKASEEELTKYYLRFTVWAREIASVTMENMSAKPIPSGISHSGSAEMGACQSLSSWSLGSPAPRKSGQGGILGRMSRHIRSDSVATARARCGVRQVGEIVVSLRDFLPLSVPHTRTDELAEPLDEEQVKRLYDKHHSLTSMYNPSFCMPGSMKLSLTYWQSPVHSIAICITDRVTLPAFMDSAMNKQRDTLLKVYLNVNGRRHKECTSIIARRCHTPHYGLREVLSLSGVSLDRDEVELVVAVKRCRSNQLGPSRSKTFAVKPLRFGRCVENDVCRGQWLQALMRPGAVALSEHSLCMDLEKLRKAV